jgi:hypothetical protein NreA
MSKHVKNEVVIKRLKRANGHLTKVIQMMDKDEGCMQVAQQLQAVFSAIGSAKKIYIQDHIEHCLSEAKSENAFKTKIREFKEVSKYL